MMIVLLWTYVLYIRTAGATSTQVSCDDYRHQQAAGMDGQFVWYLVLVLAQATHEYQVPAGRYSYQQVASLVRYERGHTCIRFCMST